MKEPNTLEREFLFYIIKSTEHIGQLISSGFKSSYLDFENMGFSPMRSLYDVACTFYTRYHTVIDRSSLPTFLPQEKYHHEQINDILLLYEEILVIEPRREFNFLFDTIRKNYASHIVRAKLTTGVDYLETNDIDKSLKLIKEGIFAAENIFSNEAREGKIQDSVSLRKQAYADAKLGKTIGIPSGFPTLDRCSGGLKGGELIIIISGTREGKSAILLNIAHHLQARLQKNIFFVSAENPKVQLERRYDALHTGLSYSKMRDGKLSAEEEALYHQYLEEIRNQTGIFYIWDQPICTPAGIEAKLLELETSIKFDLIVMDYISLAKPNQTKAKADAWEEAGRVATEFREIARRRNIPFLTAAQVNREAMKKKKDTYDIFDIAFSQAIIYHSDTVLALRVKDLAALNDGNGICEINAVLQKCRDGSQGEFTIDASFDIMKMEERTYAIP